MPHQSAATSRFNLERIRNDAKKMYTLLTQELSHTCMQELVRRLSQSPTGPPQEQEG